MRYLLIAVLIFSLVGCATIRKNALKLSAEDIKMVDTEKQLVRNFLKTWEFRSGAIRGGMMDVVTQLPCDCIALISTLDEISTNPSPSDGELGFVKGAFIRLKAEPVITIIKKYAPEILIYLP